MVFLARLADELSSSAGLLTRIGCSASATDSMLFNSTSHMQLYDPHLVDFRERLRALYENIMQRWQNYVIDKTLDDYWSHFVSSSVDPKVVGGEFKFYFYFGVHCGS